ncbi:hypothetical protein [uncultured Roseibium sp.]|uniref:hypothetical protein n=1 Tax=uncultured Roseibium sp. TaxID=1936171 RepID=UPI00321733BC
MTAPEVNKDLKKADGGGADTSKFSVRRAAELHRRGRDVPSVRDIADADLKEYAETIRILGE